jgi:hypothetical protein
VGRGIWEEGTPKLLGKQTGGAGRDLENQRTLLSQIVKCGVSGTHRRCKSHAQEVQKSPQLIVEVK